MIDLLASYDWSPVWNQCAHVVFLHPEPLPPIARVNNPSNQMGRAADLIASLHDMRLPLIDREGPRRARDGFLGMIASSRTCWERVLAETDDRDEWLPGPTQTGPGDTKITREQIDGWRASSRHGESERAMHQTKQPGPFGPGCLWLNRCYSGRADSISSPFRPCHRPEAWRALFPSPESR